MAFCRLMLLIVFVFISACSPLKQIKDPEESFERETTSLLPPKGHGWRYVSEDQDVVYSLHFSRQGISHSHNSTARYLEFKTNTNFANPEHFLNYIRNLKETDIDNWEYKIAEQQWELDDRFGEYSLRYYIVLKHVDPARMNSKEHSLLKRFGYVILHPYFDNIMIDIYYEEQGKPVEINPEFKKEALKFIEGLHLKKKE